KLLPSFPTRRSSDLNVIVARVSKTTINCKIWRAIFFICCIYLHTYRQHKRKHSFIHLNPPDNQVNKYLLETLQNFPHFHLNRQLDRKSTRLNSSHVS